MLLCVCVPIGLPLKNLFLLVARFAISVPVVSMSSSTTSTDDLEVANDIASSILYNFTKLEQ